MRYLMILLLLMPMQVFAMSTAEKNEFLANEDWIFNSGSLDENPPYKLEFSITKRGFLQMSSIVNPFSPLKKEDVLGNLRLYKRDANNNYVLEKKWNRVLIRGKGHGSYAPICEVKDGQNIFNKTSLKISFKKFDSSKDHVDLDEVVNDTIPADIAAVESTNSNFRFYGLKKLTLNGMRQDKSLVREAISYNFFRDIGLQSLRTGYAIVSLKLIGDDPGNTVLSSPEDNCASYEIKNSLGECERKTNVCSMDLPSEVNLGIYLNLETYNDDFIAANDLESSTAHLYESDRIVNNEDITGNLDLTFSDVVWTFQRIKSAIETSLGISVYGVDYCSEDEDHNGAGEPKTDLHNLRNKLLSPSKDNALGLWGGNPALNPGLHIDYIIRYFAADIYLNNWDGFSYGDNNYYLASDFEGKFKIYPSGLDQSISGWGDQFEGEEGSYLFNLCMKNDYCKSKVYKQLQYIDGVVSLPDVNGDTLYYHKVAELSSNLAPYLIEDSFINVSVVGSQQNRVKSFFNERAEWLPGFLTANLPLDSDNDDLPDSMDAFPLVSITSYRDLGFDTDDDGAPAECDMVCVLLGMAQDNCPSVANPLQVDSDLDNSGNACDKDLNNDGAIDAWDWVVLHAQQLGSYLIWDGQIKGFNASPESEY